MPKADRMAGPIRFVEHEFAAFEGNRLGFIRDLDRKTRHQPTNGYWDEAGSQLIP
jgi:hypothetical protein